MLCLSRNEFASVIITVPPSDKPTEMTVTFLEMRQGQARLSFDAPQHVKIWREEIYAQRQRIIEA